MDPVSSSYGISPSIEQLGDFRIRRQTDSGPIQSEQQSGQILSAKADRGQTAVQLGVQPGTQDTGEFKPYGPGQPRKNSSPSEPPPPDKNQEKPAVAIATTQEDPQVQQAVAQLKAIEEKVKAHEAAHKAAGGAATGPISYSYTRGPDGRNYITGGEVPITISTGRTPQETISRMQQVIQAALAPSDPSPQDRAVAAQAAAIQQTARMEQSKLQLSTTESGKKESPRIDIPDKIDQKTTSSPSPETSAADAQRSRQAYSDPSVSGAAFPPQQNERTTSSGKSGTTDDISNSPTTAGQKNANKSRQLSVFG